MPSEKKELYLTFDDGPTPGVTDWVLDMLETFDAKATFFILGKNVEKYPQLAHRAIDSGHVIGNHGYQHLDGWKTPIRTYLRDFLKAQKSIFEYTGKHTRLFRPAYAHITQSKARYVMRSHQIVMMDVISGDFDTSLNGETVAKNVIAEAEPGSIIVFHDSQKANPRLEIALPRILMHFEALGYEFKALPVWEKASPGIGLRDL